MDHHLHCAYGNCFNVAIEGTHPPRCVTHRGLPALDAVTPISNDDDDTSGALTGIVTAATVDSFVSDDSFSGIDYSSPSPDPTPDSTPDTSSDFDSGFGGDSGGGGASGDF